MAIDHGTPILAELVRFDALVEGYPDYLRGQRGLSENTVRIYLDDIGSFRQYLGLEEVTLKDMDRAMLRGYMAWLATDARDGKGYARVSIARKLTVLRSFYFTQIPVFFQGIPYFLIISHGHMPTFKSNPLNAGLLELLHQPAPTASHLNYLKIGCLIDGLLGVT